jgi:hypothetical protein
MPQFRLPMLEVTVTAHKQLAFRWKVLDGGSFVTGGSKPTRAAAKLEGECAMFRIWESGTFRTRKPSR